MAGDGSVSGGYTDRDCPLCDTMGDDEKDVPNHIRTACPVVREWRESIDLPPEGLHGGSMMGEHVHDNLRERDERGRFRSFATDGGER